MNDEKYINVGELIDWLSQFPRDYEVYAYEGETVSIVVPRAKTSISAYYWTAE